MEKTPKGLAGLRKQWHQSTLNDIKRLGLPEPDHEYGFSATLLKKSLSRIHMSKMEKWMCGQTCMLDDALGSIWYTHDVIRGMDMIMNGTPTYWD